MQQYPSFLCIARISVKNIRLFHVLLDHGSIVSIGLCLFWTRIYQKWFGFVLILLFIYILTYMCYIICYHENNVPSRLTPQWLCALEHTIYGYALLVLMNQRVLNKLSKEHNIRSIFNLNNFYSYWWWICNKFENFRQRTLPYLFT